MTGKEKMGLKVLKGALAGEITEFVFSQKVKCGVGRGY